MLFYELFAISYSFRDSENQCQCSVHTWSLSLDGDIYDLLWGHWMLSELVPQLFVIILYHSASIIIGGNSLVRLWTSSPMKYFTDIQNFLGHLQVWSWSAFGPLDAIQVGSEVMRHHFVWFRKHGKWSEKFIRLKWVILRSLGLS